MASPRKEPKSKYTAERNIPGAFEGETVTRRRFMVVTANGAGAVATAAFVLPALGFAVGSALFDRPPVRWQSIGKLEDLPNDTYVPKVITMTPDIGEVGKTTTYVRRRNDKIDKPPNPPGYDEQVVAISTRCMHLGCPVRYVQASQRFICPCHGGVYDFQGIVVGGPPVRPLDRFYTRVRRRHRRGRPALLGQHRAQALRLLPRPGAGPRRHRPVPLPAPLLDAEARQVAAQ